MTIGTATSGNTERVVVLDPDTAASRIAAEREAAKQPVVLAPSTAFLAISLGASRLAAAIVDADGSVIVRDRVSTPARNVFPALTQLVSRVMAANPGDVLPGSCGVTCPGPIDRGTGAMKPVGMPMWHDFPIRRELAAATGLSVEIDTPGRGLAMAELWCGGQADADFVETDDPDRGRSTTGNFATMVLGDDVDGAFVSGGKIVQGLTGNLGQFGHLIVEPEGMQCACGALGCLTTYAGARGIEESTGRELRRTPVAIVERTGIMVARACASVAAMLDVSEIVLGGVVPTVFGDPFFEALGREFEHRSGLDHLSATRVRPMSARIGPLVAAAAVARTRALDHTPDSIDAPDRR